MSKKYEFIEYKSTVQDIADLLGYHPQYVRILARKGSLPAMKRGRKWIFCKEELLDRVRDDTKTAVEENPEERHAINEERSAQKSDIFQ